MCGVEVLVCLGIGAAAGAGGGCYAKDKCACCCGGKSKGKVVKGQDEVVVKNADARNVKQGGLISKALDRRANKENAWSPEEQRTFENQARQAAAGGNFDNYQLEYGAPYRGSAGKDPSKKGWLKGLTKSGKSS